MKGFVCIGSLASRPYLTKPTTVREMLLRRARHYCAVSSRSLSQQSNHGAVLSILGRLEARLLNPLVADTGAIMASIEELCKLGVEFPLCYARDSVQLFAVRRDYKAIQALLALLDGNMHRPKAPHRGPGEPFVVRGSRRRDPFSQLSASAVSSTIFYSSSAGRGGLLLWKRICSKHGFLSSRDALLEVLYLHERGGKLPASFVLSPLIGSLMENRWDQTPAFHITLLRLMQRYFNRNVAYRRHFVDDLNLLKLIVTNAKEMLTPEGFRVIQYEMMYTWLLASQAARRLTDSNKLLRAEACLLEALKLLDSCLTSAPLNPLRTLPDATSGPAKTESLVQAAENRVRHSMLLLVKELENELIESSGTLRINRQQTDDRTLAGKKQNLLLTKNISIQSQRGRFTTRSVLVELSALGRHIELLNILNRLFSSSDFDFDTPFVSNGIMDNSKIVQSRDIIASPITDGTRVGSLNYPREALGQLQQIRMNVATKSVFCPGISERLKDWTHYNNEINSIDWRGELLVEVMRAYKKTEPHLTYGEQLSNVGEFATKLMSVAASHSIVLRDDFRAAWIDSLPVFDKDTKWTGNVFATHSILRTSSSGSSDAENLHVSKSPNSGQFMYSIDRAEMVDVTKLALDAEKALIENASLKVPVEPAADDEILHDKKTDLLAQVDFMEKHIEDTIFNTFFVSSFSKSLYAGNSVLTADVGEESRGAVIRLLATNYGEVCAPVVLEILRKYLDASMFKEFPADMWISVINACRRYVMKTGDRSCLASLEQGVETCAVVQRYPEVLKHLLSIHHLTHNGPEAVRVLRSIRRAGLSANFDLYRNTVIALFRFRFDPAQHEKHAHLFLRPQETAAWFLTEMKRDGIKINSGFWGDLMLLFIKNVRVWSILNDLKSPVEHKNNLYKPEYGGSDSVFTPSPVANINQLDEVIGDAVSFLMNCTNHHCHLRFIANLKIDPEKKERAKKERILFRETTSLFDRPSRKANPTSTKTDEGVRSTINGEQFFYRVEKPLYGIEGLRETLLRRLLIIVCEAHKYDLAREILKNSVTTYKIAPTSRCYEVLLQYLLLKKGNPDIVAAEDLLSEVVNSGLLVTGAMVDLFGQAQLNRRDASDALDLIQELSMQHRVMPTPLLLIEVVKYSLTRGDEMEARRAVLKIKEMKWDQDAVRPSVARLHNIFADSLEPPARKIAENQSLAGSLVDAMKMLFSGSVSPEKCLQQDQSNTELVSRLQTVDLDSPYCYENGWDHRNKILSDAAMSVLFKKYGFTLNDDHSVAD